MADAKLFPGVHVSKAAGATRRPGVHWPPCCRLVLSLPHQEGHPRSGSARTGNDALGFPTCRYSASIAVGRSEPAGPLSDSSQQGSAPRGAVERPVERCGPAHPAPSALRGRLCLWPPALAQKPQGRSSLYQEAACSLACLGQSGASRLQCRWEACAANQERLPGHLPHRPNLVPRVRGRPCCRASSSAARGNNLATSYKSRAQGCVAPSRRAIALTSMMAALSARLSQALRSTG